MGRKKHATTGFAVLLLLICSCAAHAQADWWTQELSGAWGGPDNGVITSLASYQGMLVAGTLNPSAGAEVWSMVVLFADDLESGGTDRWSSTTR